MASGAEIEIKLRLPAGEVDAFVADQVAEPDDVARRVTRTVYFDDRRRSLRRRGLELRVRSSDGAHVQTVKAGSGFERGEWEAHVPDARPSVRMLRETGAGHDLPKKPDLHAIFRFDVERRHWRVTRGGTDIELSVDRGTLAAGDARQPVAEAELELKGGSPDELFALARHIVEQHDATPSFVGKSLRGHRLASGKARSAEHALALELHRKTTVADAFAAVANACLRQVSVNEELLRAARDPEALHQMRVGVRRLRAAFSFFKPVVHDDASDVIRRDLKWLSDLLGRARDLDVFVTGPLARTSRRHPDVPGFEKMRARIEALRDEAYDRLQDALRAPRYRQLLLSILEHVNRGAWRANADPDATRARTGRVARFAADELERRFRAVARKRKAVRGDDALKRHRVRIQIKKLRYMAEFVRSLAPGKAYRHTARRLKASQDLLGALQDAVAGERLLGSVLEESGDEAMSFAADLIGREQAPAPDLPAAARAAHRKLAKSHPFWRDL